MKSFKQFIVEYISNPLIWFRNYINDDGDHRAIDLTYKCQFMIGDWFNDMEPEYDENDDEIDRGDPPEDIEELSQEDILKYGNWLLDNIDSVGDNIGVDELPSWYYMSEATIIKNSWLCHATNDASDICASGFRYGIEDLEKLGLTTYTSKQYKKQEPDNDFYSFSYTPEDFKRYWSHGKYGNDIVMFVSSGVRVWHQSDEEYQTLYMAKEARNFVHISRQDGDYTVTDKKTGRDVYRNEKAEVVVAWVIKNFPQYRSTIVQRDRNAQ